VVVLRFLMALAAYTFTSFDQEVHALIASWGQVFFAVGFFFPFFWY
jgi:hypothetical protein